MIFSIVFTLSARHSAGFLFSVYGKVRFVVNKEMINIRERWKPLAGSPSQSKPVGFARFPLLSLTRHLPPARGKSFLKVGAFGSPCKLHLFAKGSPFGRAGALAPERARTLAWEQTPPVSLRSTAPSGMGPLAWRQSFRLKRKACGTPEAPSPRELAKPSGFD